MSSGNPGPSSIIVILILFASLLRNKATLLFENFTALPIKFLNP